MIEVHILDINPVPMSVNLHCTQFFYILHDSINNYHVCKPHIRDVM
jgi:hypothetical protein